LGAKVWSENLLAMPPKKGKIKDVEALSEESKKTLGERLDKRTHQLYQR
jgi:hypothetical protein